MIGCDVSTADGRNSKVEAPHDPLDKVGVLLLQTKARQPFCPRSLIVWVERLMSSLLEDIPEHHGQPICNLSTHVGLDDLWTRNLLGPAS